MHVHGDIAISSERVFVWASILNVNFVRASQQQKRKVDAF